MHQRDKPNISRLPINLALDSGTMGNVRRFQTQLRDKELRQALERVLRPRQQLWSLTNNNTHLVIRPPEGFLQVVHFGSDFILADDCNSIQHMPEHRRSTGYTETFGACHHCREALWFGAEYQWRREVHLGQNAIT